MATRETDSETDGGGGPTPAGQSVDESVAATTSDPAAEIMRHGYTAGDRITLTVLGSFEIVSIYAVDGHVGERVEEVRIGAENWAELDDGEEVCLSLDELADGPVEIGDETYKLPGT